MEGLLAALTLIINILNPGVAVSGEAVDASHVDVTTTTTLMTPGVIQELEKCDGIGGMESRNMCYAKATSDSFFCDRIEDGELKNQCYLEITG